MQGVSVNDLRRWKHSSIMKNKMTNWFKAASESDRVEDLYRKILEMGPRQHSEGPYHIFGAEEYGRRSEFTRSMSWAVPTREAIQQILKWSSGGKIIEIGAGRGLWAKLLRDEGALVEASDPNPPDENHFFKNWSNEADRDGHVYDQIERVSGEEHASRSETGDTLMIVWPYFEDSGDSDWQASAVRNFKGDKIVFVGEHEGGATGSPQFWREINKNWTVAGHVEIPKWAGMHDSVMLFRRK